MYYDSSPVFSGGGETDIVYRSYAPAFNGTNFVGFTWCDDVDTLGDGYECDQQYINFRSTSANQALACHETGHGVGLLHGRESFPVTPNDSGTLACMSDPATRYWLGTNNVNNINSIY